jgi:hypothetical protein
VVITCILLLIAGPGHPASAGKPCHDRDGDGYFAEDGCPTERDCNDDDGGIHPGGVEVCDGRDGDCNGLLDDAAGCDRICMHPELVGTAIQVSVDPVLPSLHGNLVWAGDGWVVAYETREDGCRRILLQKLDDEGNRVGDPVLVAGGPGVDDNPSQPCLAWTGAELMLAWNHGYLADNQCIGMYGSHYINFQRFDAALQPLSPRLSLGCGQVKYWTLLCLAWSGRLHGIFWGPEIQMRFNTVDRDEQQGDDCGIVVSGGDSPSYPAVAWSGDRFGLGWAEYPPEGTSSPSQREIYFRRVEEDLGLPDEAPVRVTNEAAASWHPSLAWADGEWSLAWADARTHFSEIFMARLDSAGVKIDPPGDIRITCCNSESGGVNRNEPSLVWTGEEYGLIYLENERSLYFQRVGPDGTALGSPFLVTANGGRQIRRSDLVWNGREYGIVWDDFEYDDTDGEVYFTRLGCGCTDADEDGYSTCSGGDCDDGDPLVHPEQVEACLNGHDDNCDGAADCQDPVQCPADAGAVPGEVGAVRFAVDGETLTWDPEPGADVYDLLQGRLGDLPTDGDFSRASCLAARHPALSYQDGYVPGTGEGRYFLVRGKADRCRLGSWGSPLRDEAALTCP